MNLNGIFLTSNLKPRVLNFRFFIGGAVTFTLCTWTGVGYSGEFLTKTTAAPSQEVVEGGGVMIFFEKNKVLGVEPNRVLNILEGI